MKRMVELSLLILTLCIVSHTLLEAADSLKCEVYVSDSTSFCVTSTLIYGSHEAMLVDAQYHVSDAERLANKVLASGRRLKAIFITHPHDDHYLGMAIWKQRFPATPIYMTEAGLSEFKRSSPKYLKYMHANFPAETPDSLAMPELLPSTHLTVDGEGIQIMTDRQGDEWTPSNSYLWIPSTRTVVAGDMVFNGVHVWLANSNAKSRKAWIRELHRMEELHPLTVIAGHKRSANLEDKSDVIPNTLQYIETYDKLVDQAASIDDLIHKMELRFPLLSLRNILAYAARIAIPQS